MLLHGRTDLASEARELLSPESGKIKGVCAHEEILFEHNAVCVEILDADGERAIGKPAGRYYTLTLKRHFEHNSAIFSSAVQAASELIRRCAGDTPVRSCLVAALGNPDITPDALGSLAAEYILVTRHLKRGGTPGFDCFISTALCRTGVLGTTGVESAVQIRALCEQLHPQLVIAVDALAGSDAAGLCRSIQICDSGIAPGSGVGNDREPLSRGTLGVPVIAVGVPTVIDAATLSDNEELHGMFVTPRGIDSLVRAAARVIGYGVDLALHPGLSVEDVDMLIG